MDQYMSWSLPSDELTLDTIWRKFEEYCKPQLNEVYTQFDLFTSLRQGNCSVDDWYNAVQAQVNLAKYPQKLPKSFTETFSSFSCKMRSLCQEPSVMEV